MAFCLQVRFALIQHGGNREAEVGRLPRMKVKAPLSHGYKDDQRERALGALVNSKQRVAGLRVNPGQAVEPQSCLLLLLVHPLSQKVTLPSWHLKALPPLASWKLPLYHTQRQPQSSIPLPLYTHRKTTSQLCSLPVQVFSQ